MSIPTSTLYITDSSGYFEPTDLIDIFQTYTNIQPNPSLYTNYKINNGLYDLSQIFVLANPSFSGTSISTGFNSIISCKNYDLSKIFQTKITYDITGNYDISGNIITFYGNGTIKFYNNVTPKVLLVGGGAGGGYSTTVGPEGAGGGGAGGVGVGSLTFSQNQLYTVTIGSGGSLLVT